MNKQGKQSLEQIEQFIDRTTRSLPHEAYKELLEELLDGVESRLAAHRDEHPEL